MVTEIVNWSKQSFERFINHLKSEYVWLQAWRANSAMVENIIVDCYGQKMAIKALATITIPEPQQICINPWDKWVLGSIERAIRDSYLWLNPLNEWTMLIINIPRLTEDRRKELVKVVHLKAEEAKISVRQSRQESKSKLEKLEKDKQISEDQLRWAEEDLQNEVSQANKQIEQLSKKKDTEMMTV